MTHRKSHGNSLAANLTKLLNVSGDTKQAFSKRLNISRVTLDAYLDGSRSPTIEHLDRLAEALNVNTSSLMGWTQLGDKNIEASNPSPHISEILRSEIIEAAKIAAQAVIESYSPRFKSESDELAAANEIIELQKQELIKLRKERAVEIESSSPTLSPVRLDFTNLIAASPLDDSQLEDLLDAIREPLLGELHEPKQKKRTR